MDLIVLEGDPHIGKTETLNIVYQLLLQTGYTQIPGNFIDLANNDVLDILQGKFKVGIVTQGDYAIGPCSVKNHILHLQSKGCGKAICACTLGGSKQKIKNAIALYPHITISKIANSNISLRRIDNNKDANTILALI